MRSFDDAFGFNNVQLELRQDIDEGSQKTEKKDTTKPTVMSKELEWCYKTDPVVFNSVNKLTQIIMHPTIKLKGDNSSFFHEFLMGIGTRGGSSSLMKL